MAEPISAHNTLQYEVDDGEQFDSHREEMVKANRPGKERREKCIERMRQMNRRERARVTGISAGLSRRARKRKKKGEERDARLAQSIQDSMNVRCPRRQTQNVSVSNPISIESQPVVVRQEYVVRKQDKTTHTTRITWDDVGFAPTATSTVITADTDNLNLEQAVEIRAGFLEPKIASVRVISHQCQILIRGIPQVVHIPLNSAIRSHLSERLQLALMLVWAGNSPPASSGGTKRTHSYGACGLGVHWWREAKSSFGQEHVRLYNSWRYNIPRMVYDRWHGTIATVWSQALLATSTKEIIREIETQCAEITQCGQIERLHPSVPFTCGYVADAGLRGTRAHYDQTTVGDTWVMIFSHLGQNTTGGQFWFRDPEVEGIGILHSTHSSAVFCKAGQLLHGALKCNNRGERVVTVLWNPPKVAESMRMNPRRLVVESGAGTRTPGTTVSKYSEIECTKGLPPRALHKRELMEWAEAIQNDSNTTIDSVDKCPMQGESQ